MFNSELAKVAEWFDANKLTLNVNNTQMLMNGDNMIYYIIINNGMNIVK